MISIIIPIYNQHNMTHECINAVRECTQSDYEFVLIDNGSDPPFKPPFTGFIETILIRNEENIGYPCAINQGIMKSRGDIIILLNNDVICTPQWAERLTSYLGEFSIVGPLTNYCAGMQNVTIPVYENRDELNKEAEVLAEECNGEIEEVNWIIGFCMVFKKKLWVEIGPFDESLWPCSGEEIDFCYDKETQIVTKGGIKYFYDLTMDDEILTKNDEGKIEYQNPSEIISRKEETLLHFCSKSVDIKCSKKQNLLVGYDRKYYDYKKGGAKKVEFVLAEEINDKLWKNQSRYYIENASGYWQGKETENIRIAGREWDTEKYVEFMAWYLSEGSVCCDFESRKKRRDNQIIISQSKKETCESIFSLVKNIGFSPNDRKDGVAFSDKDLCDYLAVFGKSWEKFIPMEIKELPTEMLKLFLDTYAKGDGNKAKNGDRITWYTSSERMKDDIVELLIKTQQPFTIGLYGGGKMKFKNGTYECRKVWSIQSCFGTSVNGRGRVSLKKAKEVSYNDITYDVRVPNKRIYIMRNGKGAWSSNCLRAKKAGYKIGIAHDVYVHHEGSVTFAEMDKAKQLNYGEICTRNDEHLIKKWGADFWQRQAITEEKMGVDINPEDIVKASYIIAAPPYHHHSAGVRVLHELCRHLEKRGYKAQTTWEVIKVPSDAIVVYPEVISGNPLGGRIVVRYILNHPGLRGGDKEYDPAEILFTCNGETLRKYVPSDDRILCVPVIEDFFKDEGLPRKGGCFYVGKGIDIPRIPETDGLTEIIGMDREEVANTLKTSEIFYTYDNFSLIIEEARKCGCPVVIIGETISKMSYDDHVKDFDKQLDNFIRITQSEALKRMKKRDGDI